MSSVHCLGDVYIAYWPRNTLAVGGSTIYITCYAVSKLYTDITFTFTKDNHTLPPEVSSSSIRFADYVISSSLILYNVTPSDDGVYGCQLLHIVKTDLRNGSLLVYKGTHTISVCVCVCVCACVHVYECSMCVCMSVACVYMCVCYRSSPCCILHIQQVS